MSLGKVAIVVLVTCLAIGGAIAALTDTDDDAPVGAIDLDDGVLRRDDAADEITGVDDDDDRNKDGDRTKGNDGTGGGNNTGDGDRTKGNDGTGGGNNTGEVTYDAPAGSATGGDTT